MAWRCFGCGPGHSHEQTSEFIYQENNNWGSIWCRYLQCDSNTNTNTKQHQLTLFILGEMFGWGNTVNGELGLGGIEEEQILSPRELKFSKATQVQQVACGTNHTAVVTKDGQVYTCGSNDYSQLGHNKPRKRLEQVDGLSAYVINNVACGMAHSVAVNEWGQVFSWGSNMYGQLGMGISDMLLVPKVIKTLATCNIVQITCGLNHCSALTNSGVLYSWGCNKHGQLGLGTKATIELKPKPIKSLAGIPIAFIASGGNHTFAVSRSGAVFGWGKNEFGQLGLGDGQDRIYPCQLKTLRTIQVKYIACGEDFSVFLTKDGGVFTCGAGMFGQLGHGSTSNEFLPRKIQELMGSTVTQVSCGRRHTLTLIKSRGRVYAFGLGGKGQLGTRAALNASTPKVVLGPWSSVAPVIDDPPPPTCVIKRIYAGGDHCFATVTQPKDNIPPEDCREYSTWSQIWCITGDQMCHCSKVPHDAAVNQELMAYIEVVFSSQACVNASFLLPEDQHYCCSSRNHGLDINVAEKAFTCVSQVENMSIKELIMNCVIINLIPTLVPSPPDVETLRVYVTLPLYHEFDNPKHYKVLQNPFGSAVLNLKTEAARVLGVWWSKTANDYFERLIQIFKSVIMFLLKQTKHPNQESVIWDSSLLVSLEVLSKLHKLNQDVEGLKVPYDTFHLSELAEHVDINVDYLKWLLNKEPQMPGKIFFCNYPFLFDAQAKTIVLQTDQSVQMQSAMNHAATQALTSMIFAPSQTHSISAFLQLFVDRNNLVQDTIRELTKYNTSELKKPLKVTFLGEEAVDAGGVTKEFFMLLLREILDPKYGMFRYHEETRTMWFSEDSFEDEIMYYLVGLVCGLAIYNFTIINMPFPLALYKKLLSEPVSLQDLKGLSPTLAKSLQDVLDYEEPDLEDVFCLNFEVTREVFGEIKVIPLKPGGSEIPVTQSNKIEFVELYVDLILNKGVHKHYKAFHEGFHKVCGGRVLELFHAHELMAVVVGNENYNWEEFESNAEYRNGYTATDPTIIMFWEVFHELSLEDKKKFLLYLTGSDRIPIQGMKAIKIYLQPTHDDRFLPVAHTCFNLLDLPRYGTKEKLRYKLLQAIQQTHGFSLV